MFSGLISKNPLTAVWLVANIPSVSYRFRCPGPGVFLCESTGLVFVMVQEAELLYRTVHWDKNLLDPAGKMAAGLLFDIKCSVDSAVCQLHLPHCEVMDGKNTIVLF